MTKKMFTNNETKKYMERYVTMGHVCDEMRSCGSANLGKSCIGHHGKQWSEGHPFFYVLTGKMALYVRLLGTNSSG